MISRQFIGRLVQNFIIQNRRVDHYLSTNNIVYMYIFVRFDLETHYVLSTVGNQFIDLFLRHCKWVTHRITSRSIILEVWNFLSLGLQFFRSIECDISLAVIKQYFYIFLVNITALRLTIRTIISAETHTFIKLYAQPFEGFDNVLLRTRNKTVGISIFNTENQISAVLTRKQIIIQGSAHTTDMQCTCRTRCKTNSYFSFCHSGLYLKIRRKIKLNFPFFSYFARKIS